MFVEKLHAEKMKKDLEIMKTRLNALYVSSTDTYQKSTIGIMKGLAENQVTLIDEFEHLKKAIDLLTLHVFQVEKKLDDKSAK